MAFVGFQAQVAEQEATPLPERLLDLAARAHDGGDAERNEARAAMRAESQWTEAQRSLAMRRVARRSTSPTSSVTAAARAR